MGIILLGSGCGGSFTKMQSVRSQHSVSPYGTPRGSSQAVDLLHKAHPEARGTGKSSLDRTRGRQNAMQAVVREGTLDTGRCSITRKLR